MLLLNKPSSKYERLPLQETPFAEENAYEPGAKTDWTLRKLNCPATFTYSLTFVFGVLLGIISYHLQLSQHASSYESGLTIEISSLYTAIDIIDVRFSGTLQYTESGHLYIDLGPNGTRYFGEPSPELDDAWDHLIGGGADRSAEFPEDIIGPDVLHTLHCLNEVRMVLDSEYYYNVTLQELNRGKRIHIDHSLNHIRQIIQCHMGLTPIRTVYFESMNTEVGEFDQVHKCRDIGKLRRFMAERSAKHEVVSDSGGMGHRLGYPNTEENLLPWGFRDSEFE